MGKADFSRKLSTLKAIPKEDLKEPSNMPVAVYLREAEKLLEVGKRDWSRLKAVGFPAELLEDLPVRIGALREAQSLLTSGSHWRGGARLAWEELSAEGYKLRDDLLAALRLACRKDKPLLRTIRAAGKGRTPQAMIQSLSNLALLGRRNSTQLEAIRYDLSDVERAAAMAKSLGSLLGEADYELDRAGEVRGLRDAAFTHLQEGLKELREFGLYLFGKDQEKRLDYSSDYLRKKRLQRKRAASKSRADGAGERTKAVRPCRSGSLKSKELPGEDRDFPGKRRESLELCRKRRGDRRKGLELRRAEPGECRESSGVRTESSGVRTESSGVRTESPGMVLKGLEVGFSRSGKSLGSEKSGLKAPGNGLGSGNSGLRDGKKVLLPLKQALRGGGNG